MKIRYDVQQRDGLKSCANDFGWMEKLVSSSFDDDYKYV